jgi:eukaryotic-like serine/threonine-protein kinase
MASLRFSALAPGNSRRRAVALQADILPSRYRGPRLIGRGGMGDIYRATDDALGRAVAVKVLSERYARDEDVRERFTREALAAARLSGEPSIVTIFDVGEHNERPFIVMEYLSGGSLEDRLREEGAQLPGQALRWLEQAGRALDAAHAEGVIHRDVKPGNLLLDREGNVHVADFGIASATGMDSLTHTGTVLGTAAYLSPEQARGERASPAGDRYALAVVAFELLAGRRPFSGDTPAAEAAAHVHAEVPAISRRADLPPELDAVFRRALAKAPGERYPSCGDFVGALRHALDAAAGTTQAIEAPVRAPAAPIRRAPARRPPLVPLLVALAALALLGGGAALAVLIGGDDEPPEAGPRTVVRTVTGPGRTERVTVTAEALPPPTTPPPTPTQGSEATVEEAIALQDESTQALRDGDWERALTLSRQALSTLQGTGHTYEAYANYNIGRALAELGRCEDALAHLDRREQMIGPHPDVTAARELCGLSD